MTPAVCAGRVLNSWFLSPFQLSIWPKNARKLDMKGYIYVPQQAYFFLLHNTLGLKNNLSSTRTKLIASE